MRNAVWIAALAAFLWGCAVFYTARGSVHEVYAALFWLMACVLSMGNLLLVALDRMDWQMAEQRRLLERLAER